MFPAKYQAVMLLLLVMVAWQAVASPRLILTNPRQLQVKADPSRAAIIVSRTVTPATEAPSTTTSGSTAAADASTTTATTTTKKPAEAVKTTGEFELAFTGIRELDSNSSEVGGAMHSFYEFKDAALGFLTKAMTTDNMHTDELPMSTSVQGVCQESRAVLHKAGADVPNATVIAKMCAVESNGNAFRDGEAMRLTAGQFLLSVEVEGWQWCGCGQQEGEFLEFTVTAMVPSGYKISRDNQTVSNMPVKITLGTNDSFIMVSSKYEASAGSSAASWKSMPTGYPMVVHLDEEERRANVTSRLPRQGSGDRQTIMVLLVEPGYISSEHVKPGPTSSAPSYVGTLTMMIATMFFITAAMFSQR